MTRRTISIRATRIPISLMLVLALAALLWGQRADGARATNASAWTPELSMNVKGVGNVRVSPDGARVLFTVNETIMTADKSEYLTQIWTAQADGSDSYQITFGDKSSSNPDWSPDGRWIAFTSARSGKNNLYLMRTAGGEAEMITDVKSGVGAFSWSPDGKWIAFAMTDPPSPDDGPRSS